MHCLLLSAFFSFCFAFAWVFNVVFILTFSLCARSFCLLSARIRFCCLNYMSCIGRERYIYLCYMLIYFIYIWTEIVAAKLWAEKQVQLQLELFPFSSDCELLCVCACVNICVCVCLYFLNQTFAMKLQLAMPISPIVGISFCGTVIKMQTAICHFQLLLSVFFLLFAPPLYFFCLAF